MPVALFSLKYLEDLTKLSPQLLEKLAFDYGLEAETKGDTLEVEVTAERPDLLSAEGFSRVINAFNLGKTRNSSIKLSDSGLTISVDRKVQSIRPYIGGLIAENVKLNQTNLEALIQFQDKVCQTYGRQRKKIAIGVYNASKINGNIKYTAEDKNAISFVPLNGKEALTGQQILAEYPTGRKYADALPEGEYVPILLDASGQILSMPPIINAHGIGSITPEASRLFVDVTGTSERAVKEMLSIIAHNFLDINAQVKAVTVEYAEYSVICPDLVPTQITCSINNLNKIIGVKISEQELSKHLRKMDLSVKEKGTICIPSYRTDILGEVDIAGDLLIAIGLDNLEPDLTTLNTKQGKSSSLKDYVFEMGDLSQRMGLIEVKSLILIDPAQLSLFANNYVETDNAKSRTFSSVRVSLQPGMIEILSKNITARKPVNIYETGEVLHIREDGSVYETISWGFASLDSQASFTTAKSYIHTMLEVLQVDYQLIECNKGQYISGRAAYIVIDGIRFGHFGEIHPQILNYFSFPEPISSGEVDCKLLSSTLANLRKNRARSIEE
jgi:phenylalanyl-tRNA synthetase beta chain